MESGTELEYIGPIVGKAMVIDEESLAIVTKAKAVFDSALSKLLN
jgi:DUF2075 family protein